MGELKLPDGKTYKGVSNQEFYIIQEYDNDKKHGKGVFKWEDGRKYAGCWK